MENIKDIIQNLKTIFQLRDDKEVAEKLGISDSNFSKMKSRNKIPYENLFEISKKENIDINSIIYGQNGNIKINYKNKIIENIDKLTEQEQEYIYHIIESQVIKKEI